MSSPIETVLREFKERLNEINSDIDDGRINMFDATRLDAEAISHALSQIRGLMPKHIKKYAIEGESPLTEREIGHNLCLSEILKLLGEGEQ